MTENTQNISNPRLPFKIGVDPEFLMFNGKKALDAKTIITGFLKSNTEIEPKDMGFYLKDIGEIGWDGASSTGELRTEPGDDPEIITERLRKLINFMLLHLPAIDFTTLSIGSPIGGHIHIEIPEEKMGPKEEEENDSSSLPIKKPEDIEKEREINRIKKLISTFLMPIYASEHRISSISRMTETKYGKADDFRWHERQNNILTAEKKYTIEIRGISAEWLTTPKLTNATLAYVATIVNEIMKNNQKLIREKVVLKTKGHIDAIQTLMLSDFRIMEKFMIDRIKRLVRKFELYDKFKEEIEFILNPAKAMREKEKNGWNIGYGWKFKENKNPTKKDLMSSKKLIKNIANVNQNAIENGFTIPYNDDYNISFFAKAMADRIISQNWKLKNEYFLFGLREKINGYVAMRTDNQQFFTMPENGERKILLEICQKMTNRFQNEINIPSNAIKIDPKTGKIIVNGRNQIIIGIPYEDRTRNNVKNLINLIWQIENKKLETKDHKEFTLKKEKMDDKNETILKNAELSNNFLAEENIITNVSEREIENALEDDYSYATPISPQN